MRCCSECSLKNKPVAAALTGARGACRAGGGGDSVFITWTSGVFSVLGARGAGAVGPEICWAMPSTGADGDGAVATTTGTDEAGAGALDACRFVACATGTSGVGAGALGACGSTVCTDGAGACASEAGADDGAGTGCSLVTIICSVSGTCDRTGDT